jgi:hypothetical protein
MILSSFLITRLKTINRISKSETRNKFKAQMLQCSKPKSSRLRFWSFEFGSLGIVSARPGATFSVHIGIPSAQGFLISAQGPWSQGLGQGFRASDFDF